MEPYVGVEYNLTLGPLQSPLQHIYHGHWQPYARVDLIPVPESTLSPSQGLRIWLLQMPQTKRMIYMYLAEWLERLTANARVTTVLRRNV